MKVLLILYVAIAGSATSQYKDTEKCYKKAYEGKKYFYYSGDDGSVALMSAEEPVDRRYIENYIHNPKSNKYWLFTRNNKLTPQNLFLYNTSSIIHSNYDSQKVTVFLVHGWRGDGKTRMNLMLTDAFLVNEDVNVIVFDWSYLASKSYITAKCGTAAVGKMLGRFIKWLVDSDLASYYKIHIVGFSLGGQLVGNAGRENKGDIARITALDPAGPLWSLDPDRLAYSDAQYVEVIHTDTLSFGFPDPCGDADFFPNGGFSMPGCLFVPCSHSRAYEYMASSVIYNQLIAHKCGSYMDAIFDQCAGNLYPMGNSQLNKTGRGIFRVNTKSDYPYY